MIGSYCSLSKKTNMTSSNVVLTWMIFSLSLLNLIFIPLDFLSKLVYKSGHDVILSLGGFSFAINGFSFSVLETGQGLEKHLHTVS